jgi:ankyrin repeat protein
MELKWVESVIPTTKIAMVFCLLLVCGCHANSRSKNDGLLSAIQHKDTEAVRRIIAGGIDLEPASGPYEVIKPLAYAAAYGNLEIVKLLVEAGADLNGRVAYGDVPLIKAAEHKNDDILVYLIEQGADVNTPNAFGITPFIGYCGEGDLERAQLAAKHGGDMNSSFVSKTNQHTGEKNMSPLQAAAAAGRLEVVELLLSLGADPQAKDNWGGKTALEVAESNGHAGVADLLRRKRK